MNPQDQQQQYTQPPYPPQPPAAVPQPAQPESISPAQPSQAPAPTNSGSNPYEFILNPDTTHHKTSSDDSLLKRILVIVGIVAVITIIGTIAVRLLVPKDNSVQQVTTIAQEQQELVRVATYIVSHAKSTDLVNFAINTEMSVSTNQQASVEYVANRGVELGEEQLALKKDTKTDTLLSAATSTNTFDSTATQTLTSQLNAYQTSLKKAYNASSGKKARAVLQASYDTAVSLAAQGTALSK